MIVMYDIYTDTDTILVYTDTSPYPYICIWTCALQQHYAEDPVSDYVQAAVTTAVAIHEQDLPGDILIFLTGQEECESAVSMLEEEARRYRRAQGSSLRLMPVALYAGLPAASQLQVFEATPRGYRKVWARCEMHAVLCCFEFCCKVCLLCCAVVCCAVL